MVREPDVLVSESKLRSGYGHDTDQGLLAGANDVGLRIAQQMILATSEFHTANIVKTTDQPREQYSFPEPQEKPYRAVVYVMLNGGCDSYNMLAPYTCSNGLYESYISK